MKRVSHKFFLPLLLVGICLSVAYLSAVPALADGTYYTEGFFQYSIHGDSVSIHSYYGNESEVVIPDHIAALPVTEIEAEAFSGNTTVTKITIPYTISSVGESAFSNMSKLKTVVNQSEGLEIEVPESVVIQEDYPVYINSTDEDVGIDAGDGSYVTVDNTDNLIVVDKDNNITVIDRNHTYTLTTDENGQTIITDENGNQVQVSDNGEITYKGDLGNSVTKNMAGESVSEEGIVDAGKVVAAIGVIAVILALLGIFIRKKKKKVSDSNAK
jgi:hypothetical protein